MVKRKSTGWIAYVAILLVAVVIAGIIARFTNGFTDDFKTFYIRVDGKEIMSSADGYEITPEKPLHAEVKYTFSFASDESKGYSVKIVPNASDKSKDFSYTVNGEKKSFQSEEDFSEGFEIEKGESSFTITPKGATLTEVLQAIYPEIETEHLEEKAYNDMFVLAVSSYNGKSSVRICFTLRSKVTGIKLNKEAIVF